MEVNRRLLTTMKGLMELTSNQRTILDLVSEGLSFSDVARKLSVTKQHIQQTYRLATSLILSGLIDVARVTKLKSEKSTRQEVFFGAILLGSEAKCSSPSLPREECGSGIGSSDQTRCG